ncbi:MAG TPA: antitoxin Xre/MbcA/ParS toxin-binding domain-containing protein [candidate division Zixibacteria bacterium]|nr:antitoxin Xre/MbcA/ParS toxin-binding domain-containing protein [candidate division Zixibacteria bacterium]
MAMTAEALSSLPARLLAAATGASPRTAQRWRAGVRPRRTHYRLRLADLGLVWDDLGPGLKPRARAAWLMARNAHLGGRRPVDLLAEGEVERVRGAALAYLAGDVT